MEALAPFLLVIPASLIGPVVMIMLVFGGLLIVAGIRKAGQKLVFAAIALPIINVLIAAATGMFFAKLPGWLALPVAWLFAVTTILGLGWALIKVIFGQHAVDEALGHILADILKALLRFTFSRKGALALAGSFVIFAIASVVGLGGA